MKISLSVVFFAALVLLVHGEKLGVHAQTESAPNWSDVCQAAESVSTGELKSGVSTSEVVPPSMNDLFCNSNFSDFEAWYSWTPAEPGDYLLAWGFDPEAPIRVYVLMGEYCEGLAQNASGVHCVVEGAPCDKESCYVTFHVDSLGVGSVYRAVMSNFYNANGTGVPFAFQISLAPIPPDEWKIPCEGAIDLGEAYNGLLKANDDTCSNQTYIPPLDCVVPPGKFGAWYKFAVVETASWSISTCGTTTDFETVLDVLQGTTCSLNSSDTGYLQCVGSNHWSSCGRSQVFFSGMAGYEYYVLVSGVGSACGSVQLNFSTGNTTDWIPQCEDAVAVTDPGSGQDVNVIRLRPVHLQTGDCNLQVASVGGWLKYAPVANSSYTVSIDCGVGSPCLIHEFGDEGCSASELTCVGHSWPLNPNGTASVLVTPDSMKQHAWVVSGDHLEVGTQVFVAHEYVDQWVNPCIQAVPLTFGANVDVSYVGNSTSRNTYEPVFSGCSQQPGVYGVWHSFTAPKSGQLVMTTCDVGYGNPTTQFNTIIDAIGGNDCSMTGLTCLASNHYDQHGCGFSKLSVGVIEGETYYAIVSGSYADEYGVYRLTIYYDSGNWTDACNDATEVWPLEIVSGSTDEIHDPDFKSSACPIGFGEYGQWFKWYPSEKGDYEIRTLQSDEMTILHLLRGPECCYLSENATTGLECLGHNWPPNSPLKSTISPDGVGAQFFIVVSDWGAEVPGITFDIRIVSWIIPCESVTTLTDYVVNSTDSFQIFGPTFSNCSWVVPGEYGLWYEWSPSVSGEYDATTCNPSTNFSATVFVMEGSQCCNHLDDPTCLQCVQADDYDPGCIGFGSTARFYAEFGESYRILVTGVGSESGKFNLSVIPSSVVWEGPCMAAVNITSYWTDNTIGFPTDTPHFPACGACTEPIGTWGKWAMWQAPETTEYFFTTCSSATEFSTAVHLFEGSECCYYGSTECLECMGCAGTDPVCPETSWLKATVVKGRFYHILVSGKNNEAGVFNLTIGRTDAWIPLCEDAVALTWNTVDKAGTTVGKNTYEPRFGCDYSVGFYGTWYSFESLSALETEVEISIAADWTSMVHVLFGGACTSGLNCATVSVPGARGVRFGAFLLQSFMILVNGYEEAEGAFTISLGAPSTAWESPCSSATVVVSHYSGSASSQTFQPIWPDMDCPAGKYGQWIKWTAPSTTQFAVNVTSHDFFFNLHVLKGSSCSYAALTGLACVSSEVPSYVSLDVNEGEEYYVLVSGQNGVTGEFDMSFDYEHLTNWTDPCRDAVELPENTDVWVTGYIKNKLTYDPVFSDCESPVGKYGLWYDWVAPITGEFVFTTCSPKTDFDSVVHVLEGTECCTYSASSPSCVQCRGSNDRDPGCPESPYGASVWLNVVAGQRYFVLISGWGTAYGTFNLTIRPDSAGPEWEVGCNQAASLNVSGYASGNTAASLTYQPYFQECDMLVGVYGEWFTWTAPSSGPFILSTCSPMTDFDTVLHLFEGDYCCQNQSATCLQCVAASDYDPSCHPSATIQFEATSGRKYHIILSGWGTEAGNFLLSMKSAAQWVGPCLNAASFDTSASGNTQGQNIYDPNFPDATQPGGTYGVWYSWVSYVDDTVAMLMDVDTASSFDYALFVFRGSDCSYAGSGNSGLHTVAVTDYSTYPKGVIVNVNATTEYHFLMTGRTISAGAFMLSMQSPPSTSWESKCTSGKPISLDEPVDSSTKGQTISNPLFVDGCAIGEYGIWFKWIATESKNTTAYISGHAFDVVVHVFRGEACNYDDLVAVDCGLFIRKSLKEVTEDAGVSFMAIDGDTFHFLVTGIKAEVGDFSLRVSDSPPSPQTGDGGDENSLTWLWVLLGCLGVVLLLVLASIFVILFVVIVIIVVVVILAGVGAGTAKLVLKKGESYVELDEQLYGVVGDPGSYAPPDGVILGMTEGEEVTLDEAAY